MLTANPCPLGHAWTSIFLKANVTSTKDRAHDALIEDDKVQEVERLQESREPPCGTEAEQRTARGGSPELGTPLTRAVTAASLVSTAGQVLPVGMCEAAAGAHPTQR